MGQTKRRTPYVPLDSFVAFKRTGQALKARWGMEGLCAWMLFLAACKRDVVPGTFTYTSEDEAWVKLGAQATLFTIEEFFAATGRMRQTRKRVSGHVTYVSCTHWAEWNVSYQTQVERERKQEQRAQKPSKSVESKRDKGGTMSRAKSIRSEGNSKGQSVVRSQGKADVSKTNLFHVDRLLVALKDSANGKTRKDLIALSKKKPPAAFELAREEVEKRSPKNRAGYAIRVIENYGVAG